MKLYMKQPAAGAIVFVYGSLMFEEVTDVLLKIPVKRSRASLDGFHRANRRSAASRPTTPALIPRERARVAGVLLEDISSEMLATLDAFEEVDREMYLRKQVAVLRKKHEILEAEVYVAGPTTETFGTWDVAEFERTLETYLDLVVRPFAKSIRSF